MSTRSGHLDPGVLWHLSRTEGMSMQALFGMLSRESGLLGLSETTPDMGDLLAQEATDERAADAVAVFCYQVRKWIGSFAAALGGLDTLVFCGGIGEGSAEIRQRIGEGLGFLGVEIDAERNAHGAAVISREGAPVVTRVMRTDEELMIAEAARDVLDATRGVR
jgi:acetate kinase